MNVKTNKTKKQANVENQAVNLLSKEELCKRIEDVEKELKSYTWRELETNGKFAKNDKLSFIKDDMLIVGCDIGSETHYIIQYNNENSLSSVLTIAYLSAMQYYFKPIREFPTGRGFADFVFIPKPEYKNDYPALLVELKWNQNAQTALTQIKTKKYPSSILNYTGDILLVGINYDKKSKEHQCLIEKYVKGENRGTGVV